MEPPQLTLEGFNVPYTNAVRYLGVWLDRKLRFATHLEKTAAKAATTAQQLARLMPNIGGPKTNRRKLMLSVVHSTLLYAAPIWAEKLHTQTYRKRITCVQRRCALRVAAAYRTVSEDAVLVIVATPPADLLAVERKERYAGMGASEARKITMDQWQRRWDSSTKGRWTHRLIGDVMAWCNRGQGNLGYHITQLLSGHGCFGEYLCKIRKEETPRCHHCDAVCDDAEHTIFVCPAWEAQRQVLSSALGRRLTVGDLIQTAAQDAERWTAFGEFAATVMKEKEASERRRRKEAETQH